MDRSELVDRLAGVLAPVLGPVEIEHLARLTGGASRETWSFDAVGADAVRHELILQRNRGGATLGLGFDVEDALLSAARDTGVPIAEIVVDAGGCTSLGDGRITRRIAGETLGPRIVRGDAYAAVRAGLVGDLARALAAVHAIPVEAGRGLDEPDPTGLLRAGFDGLGIVSPAFEMGIRWLAEHRRGDVRTCVVHGDFRVGNLMVDDTGLRAVLDWELAHLGDPVEDLGWLCVRAWRFGGDRVVGGVGDLEDLLDAYRDASGTDVTSEQVRWWMIAGTLRWGLICAVQASRHLGGHVTSVELATIGRRIAENEHDVLDLLGVPAHPPDEPLPTVDQGRPTAAELVAAVRSHLTDNVIGELGGGVAFSTKVAANALAIVQRELAATPPVVSDVDEVDLAARIRAGETISDTDVAALRAAVTARIAVTNPRWAGMS